MSNKQKIQQDPIDQTTSPRILLHEEAKQTITEYIRRQQLKPGDKLPTEHELCKTFGWSRVTIARALNAMEWEGKLRRVQGSGTYVSTPKANDRAARRLLVSSWPYEPEDHYAAALFAGVRDEAAERGVDIVYFHNYGAPDVKTVEKWQVDGVLSLSWRVDDLHRVIALRDAAIPIVGLAYRSRIGPLPLICSDNCGAMLQAVEHLVDEGHREIAFATVNVHSNDVIERLVGFEVALAKAGLVPNPDLIFVGNVENPADIIEKWWTTISGIPTAIILMGQMAPEFLPIIIRDKVAVPEDLSVILVDDVQAAKYFSPPLTVLRQPTYEMGRRGVVKLIGVIEGGDDGAMEVLPIELVKRSSVGPPRRS